LFLDRLLRNVCCPVLFLFEQSLLVTWVNPYLVFIALRITIYCFQKRRENSELV
jgi:hypothetical protein